MTNKLACQTITWGEEQRHFLPAVFDQVAAAGFDGVEIGFRHIRETPPEQLRDLLSARGLVLAATHIGGNLEDPAQASAERTVLLEILDYLERAGSGLLMYSGLRYQSADQFERDLGRLSRAAVASRERGVRLLYHNHDWEFADQGCVIHALVHDAGASLGFCPDIGWAHRGGADVLPLLESIKGRVGAVHFKDFAREGAENPFVLLGDGIAPLREAADWLIESGIDAWAIAEQDRADILPGDAAAHNGRYLREITKGVRI